MARPNQLSRYGAVAKTYAALNPQAKVFFLAPASAAWLGDFMNEFPVDSDGVTRVYTTLTSALAACVASRGDVILALPGYTESISAAAGVAIATVGVSIIGLGNGSLRPTITFDTATSATMTITAANVTLDNLIFTQAFDAIVSPIVISAAGVTIKNCYFMTANASYQCTQMILTTAAANNLTISGNRFVGTVDAGTTAAITIVGGDNAVITNNDFIGAYSSGVGAIRSITTLNTNCLIRGNTIVNVTASSTKGITLLTGSTGVATENKFGIGSGAAPITSDAAWWAGNWSAAAVATNGTLV
jgi:hypothetical protein